MAALIGCGRSEFNVPVEPSTPPATARDGGAAPLGQDGGAQVSLLNPDLHPPGFAEVVAGADLTCARVESKMGCWGNPTVLQAFGISQEEGGARVTFGAFARSLDVVPQGLSAAGRNVCVLQNGVVWCGVREMPTASNSLCNPLLQFSCRFRLTPMPLLPSPALSLSVSSTHACAIVAARRVACWGQNDKGQLGHAPGTEGDTVCPSGSGFCNDTPTMVAGLEPIFQLAVGAEGGEGTSCAVGTNGHLFCWGSNQYGNLGLGFASKEASPSPKRAEGEFRQVTVGETGACAVALDGKTFCWDEAHQLVIRDIVKSCGSRANQAATFLG